MNELILSIGSNKNPEANLVLCRQMLNQAFGEVYFSDILTTTPYGSIYKDNFLNQLAYTQTSLKKEDIISSLKDMEKRIGRLPSDKSRGEIKIDIDLIKWNDLILKENEWERDYIAKLMPSLEKVIVSELPYQK